LEELHPCDFQTTLKKGCALPYSYQNTSAHKRSIIAGYYAMYGVRVVEQDEPPTFVDSDPLIIISCVLINV
jgi:hypothetical protein